MMLRIKWWLAATLLTSGVAHAGCILGSDAIPSHCLWILGASWFSRKRHPVR
ncbi:hypothetical protein ACFSKS_00535 [Pseudocitrobacter faecalis]